jgi:hypothetical protein
MEKTQKYQARTFSFPPDVTEYLDKLKEEDLHLSKYVSRLIRQDKEKKEKGAHNELSK